MNEFCRIKGIKREFSVARTPQQNGVAEKKNRTLIETARTMLADSLLPTPPSISFMRPFGCPVTILNTLEPLGKFDGKAKEGFLVGYSINSKAFRVFNSQTRKVEEITAGNQTNKNAGPQEANGNTGLKQSVDAGQSKEKNVSTQQYIMFPLWCSISSSYKSSDENDTADDSVGESPV
ncbi:putative ribonuclease H-like domain-containing protein [Tanacetum coccineum]